MRQDGRMEPPEGPRAIRWSLDRDTLCSRPGLRLLTTWIVSGLATSSLRFYEAAIADVPEKKLSLLDDSRFLDSVVPLLWRYLR